MHESYVKLGETQMNSGQYRAADLVIDFDAGIVTKHGQALTLPDLTWRTLCCLLERPGAIVSIDQLIETVWGDVSVSNETVTQRIKLLRRALEDDGQNPHYVETVRGRGFRFIAEPVKAQSLQRSRILIGAPIAAALIVGIAVFGMQNVNDVPPADAAARVVARGNEYLARIKREDNQIAIELYEEALRRDADNVGALVGLSFASAHNASKFNMPFEWTKKAQKLAERALALGGGTQAHHALGFSLDAQGKVDEAITQYEKALELEPDNAAAISSVAYLYQRRGQLARALEYGLRANMLNPDIAFSEVQVAATLFLLGRDTEANEWLNRGMMLKPDNVFIYSAKTDYLMSRGQFGSALDTIAEAQSRGIHRPELLVHRGLIAAEQGRWEEAREAFEAASQLDPTRATGKPYSLWLRLQEGDAQAQVLATDWIAEHRSASDYLPLLLASGLELAQGYDHAALLLLNEAVEKGFRDWRWLERHPVFSSIQGTEELIAIVTAIQALVIAENAKVDQSK